MQKSNKYYVHYVQRKLSTFDYEKNPPDVEQRDYLSYRQRHAYALRQLQRRQYAQNK